MRKLAVFALAVVVIALGATTALYYQRYEKSRAEYATLQADEHETRNRYGQAINEIAAIQDSLNTIILGDQGARQLTTELYAEQKLTKTEGDEALARIAVIKAGIERTKDRVEVLEANLQKSGVMVAGLERMVKNLKSSLAEREQMVATLTSHVDSLQTTVTQLATEVEEGQATIAEQATNIEDKRRELGTVYYTIGNKKDLTTAGIVVAKGGVLGMGKTLEATGYVGDGFTALDTDMETVIRIPAEKAQVLSDQPSSSYELTPVGKELELRITNPERFRTVKHVVIVTA